MCMEIICEQCGKSMEAKKSSRRFCEECSKSRAKDAMTRYRQSGVGVRGRNLVRFHGITAEQWDEIWQEQEGLCYLCEEVMTRPLDGGGRKSRGSDAVIDHDHECCPSGRSCSSCRRGLAHRWCNDIAGRAHDDPDFLRKIADNLAGKMGP